MNTIKTTKTAKQKVKPDPKPKKVKAELVTTRMGRPPKWEGDITISKALDYVSTCVDQYKIDKESKKVVLEVNLPSIEGLSLYLGVDDDTIVRWEKKYPDFYATTRLVKKLQRKVISEKGLSGQYNPIMARFMLMANHGMSEKTENKTEHTIRTFAELSDDELESELLRIKERNGK